MSAYSLIVFKQFYRSPVLFFLLFFPFIFLLGMGSILPVTIIVAAITTISICVIIIVFFGNQIMGLKETMLIKSISLTTISKSKIFFINIIFAFALSVAMFLWILFLGWLFTVPIDFLISDFSSFDEDLAFISSTIDYGNLYWGNMIYAVGMTIMLTFAMTFFLATFLNSRQVFVTFIIVYIPALIIFAGVVLPSFLIGDSFVSSFRYIFPHFYTNNLIISSLNVSGFSEEAIDTTLNTAIEFLGSIDSSGKEAILGDLNALNSWYDSGLPTVIDSQTGKEVIDWGEVVGEEFQNGYIFVNEGFEFLSELLISNPQMAGETLFLVTNVLEGIYSGSYLENLIILESWTDYTRMWDLNNLQSTLDIFLTWGVVILMGLVSIFNFNWTRR